MSQVFRTRRALVALVALLSLVCAAPAAAKDRKPGKQEFEPGTLLVKFETPGKAAATARAQGDRAVAQTLNGVSVVKLEAGESVRAEAAEYEARKDVVFAEPNWIRRLDVDPPNDPLYQWSLAAISAVSGWTLFPGAYSGSGGVPIAVIDTGIDSTHPDLSGKVLSASGANCQAGTCVAWSGGSTDDNGHGTHVAGIAGASTNNGLGIAGVGFASPLIPIKVCTAGGSCSDAAIANGITWARTHGAKVINLSLGGYGGGTTICGAVSQAIAAGVTVVAAAGNQSTSQVSIPAGCTGAIGVAATDSADASADFSNWDYPNAFISAPGVAVLSSVPPLGYESWNGTSMASPHVAGLAALLAAQQPLRTPGDVRRLLAKSAEKVGAEFGYYGVQYGQDTLRGRDPFAMCSTCTWHPYYGYGLIDVDSALEGLAPRVNSLVPAAGAVGAIVTLTGEELVGATEVAFGGVPASFTIVNGSKITATVPAAATTGGVRVTTPEGTATSATFNVLPRIVSLAPTSGPTGTALTIVGSGLAAATSVKIGTVAAPIATKTANEITTTVPAAAVTGKVSVTTPSGTVTSTTNFGVKPSIASFTPMSAAAGAPVVVTGTTLVGVTSVKVNGVAAPFTLLPGGTQLRLTIPTTAGTGKISVTNAGGTVTSVDDLNVLPKVNAFTPAAAVANAIVTVSGTGLFPVAEVRFNGVAAALAAGSTATALKVLVPSTATNGTIAVETAAGTATSTASFKVLPKIGILAPTSGPTGTPLTITGSGFGGATSVKLGTTALTHTVDSPTQITTAIPANGVSGKIAVTTPSGTATSAANFGVTPTIAGFAPASALAGAPVVVTGTTLVGVTSVKVNGVVAPFVLLPGGTQLRLTVPAAASSGAISVTNAGGTVTSVDTLTVLPKVTSFTPAAAVANTLVTVNGSGFAPGATTVRFNGVPATVTTATGTSLKVTVPADATNGTISVETAAGTATSVASFKVLPKVGILAPTSGSTGTALTITGSGFAGATGVKLGTAPMTYSVDSPTQITATVPANGVTGKVSVTTPSGTALSTTNFGVTATVTDISPAAAAAGSPVVLTGTTLVGVTSVKVNGVAAAFALLPGGTQLRLTVPMTATSGPITVMNAGGTTVAGTLSVLPKVTSFLPATGVAAGTLVAINGGGFTPASTVTFTNAEPVAATYVSPTTVRVTVPAGASSGPLQVETGAGAGAPSTASFTVSFSVTSLSPDFGGVGEEVTIGGLGFTGVTAVRFGATPAPFTVVSPTEITTAVPAGASTGPVTVVKGSVSTRSADDFFFFEPPPTITQLSPSSGPVGTEVTIGGFAFTGATEVTFGGVAAAFTVDSATQITATVPAGAPSGYVRVTTPVGTSTGVATFFVLPTLVLNEVNANIWGNADLLELRVTAAGSLGGLGVYTNWGGGTTEVAALPAINVAAGDLVVVHFTPPAGVTAETAGKGECADPACYPGAWDVLGNSTGFLTSGNTVLAVAHPAAGQLLDAVPFTNGGSAEPGFPGQLQALQLAGRWSPANCGAVPCAYDTTPSAQSVSVPWGSPFTDASGDSVARTETVAPHDATEWAAGPQTFGAPNSD
jgi:subtilisin family serine protease